MLQITCMQAMNNKMLLLRVRTSSACDRAGFSGLSSLLISLAGESNPDSLLTKEMCCHSTSQAGGDYRPLRSCLLDRTTMCFLMHPAPVKSFCMWQLGHIARLALTPACACFPLPLHCTTGMGTP